MPSPFARLVLIALIGAAVGCGKTLETGVLVVVDADAQVREDARSVEIMVYGGGGTPGTLTGLMTRDVPPGAPGVWPIVIGFSPRGGDADRVWGLEVRAVDQANKLVVVRRLKGSFGPGRTLFVRTNLEASCIDMACGDSVDSSCRAGACGQPDMIDPATAEDWDGRSDFGDPIDPLDAG